VSWPRPGPQIEDSLEKFYQVHQYLGEEIVVSGATDGRNPSLLVVAEVRKQGLKKFLEQTIIPTAKVANPSVRVFDPKELANAEDKGPAQDLLVLVRPDFVIAVTHLATLRSFNALLDRHNREFVSTPFGQRVSQEYHGGLTMLGAADLEKILDQMPPGTKQNAMLRDSGFADVRYLIWEHKRVGAQAVSQAELSFNGRRCGPAAWLAKPGRLPSLDFVSPNAIVAGAIVLTNPAQIFEDIKELAGPGNSSPIAALPQMEQALGLSLKEDLLSLLGGEFAVEVDSITAQKPEWKAMLSVRNATRLQQTLSTLLAAAHFQAEQAEEEGVTYHTVLIPSSQKSTEIGYAFADGYLIIGSSHGAVAEAVRLHRSGGGLAKSPKFLAAQPAGHSLDASALLYENPSAMAVLQLRRIAPEMESLAQFSRETPSVVACLYGEETAIREASSSGGFDVGAALVVAVAAVAIPNLLRSKIAANEASAVGSVRTVNTAQVTYAATYPERGFAPNLATLGSDPRNPTAESPEHANFIDASLANEACTADAWCTKSGFRFRVTAVCKQHRCEDYVVVATPVDTNTGGKNFCSISDAIVRFKTGPPLTSPVTISECKTWAPLQ
jgi:type IV pilus assembly protein PilA